MTTQRRRMLAGAAAVVVAAAAATALATTGGTDVTKARLERDLPVTFANLYVQQARILGHRGVTAASLHARAECDRGGPHVADRGPGADWICLMGWDDPNVPLPDGYGKFELNVHSNDCYTAGGPSKLVGQLTITDAAGKDVTNPVFEFDGCFDPSGGDAPTGVVFPKPSTTATPASPPAGTPAAVAVASPSRLHGGVLTIRLTCSAGDGGCAGTLRVLPTGRTATYAIAAGASGTVRVPVVTAVRPERAVHLAFTPVIGTAPTTRVTTRVAPG